MTDTDGERTAVYRLYADSGRLLYVGATNDVEKRLRQHSSRAWWPEVMDHQVTWYDDRPTALKVEGETIRAEQPVHNLMGMAGQSEGFRNGVPPQRRRRVEMLGVNAVRPALSERLDLANLPEPTHTLLTKGNDKLGALVGMEWYRRARAALGEPTDL